MKRTLWIPLLALLFMGAECIPGEIDVPYEAETPEITIDLEAQVQKFEASINDGSDDNNKLVLAALCATESGRNCSPPSLPASIPRQLPDPRPGNQGQTLNVTDWMGSLPALDDLKDISQAISFNPGQEVGVSTPEQVKKVTITGLVVKFKDNTLTYPMPPMKTYVGTGIENAALEDAQQLIEQSRVTLFGTLDEIPAADVQPHPMALDDAGKSSFSEALKKLDVALAVQSVVDFPPPGTGPITKPDGKGTMSATIKATFTIETNVDQLF
ncbi:MAG: hypothetical protein ABIJ09_14160 [Pseudomonadota bacterium]